jgi:hypothetical protein
MNQQTSKSAEQEISMLFQTAAIKLEKIEIHAKKEKTELSVVSRMTCSVTLQVTS